MVSWSHCAKVQKYEQGEICGANNVSSRTLWKKILHERSFEANQGMAIQAHLPKRAG
jgi:hypothetical protein